MNELALFAGGGGGLLATKYLLGWDTVCYVEYAPYPVEILKARISEGYLDDAPIWDDCRTFDGRPWRGLVDIITAGFPCQPFSAAGRRKADGDLRNGWPATIRIIREVRPRFCLLENVSGLLSAVGSNGRPYFGRILGDLAESGYDARWRVLSAAELGAPIMRDRLFIVAISDKINGEAWVGAQQNGAKQIQSRTDREMLRKVWIQTIDKNAGSATGVANYVDRVEAIGNGQVPIVVKTVWELLTRN